MLAFSDNQKVGVLLTSLSLLFALLGVMMFFDRGMLSLANLLFLAGITFIIGARRTVNFFVRARKWRGTVVFFSGILLLLSGYTFIGFIVEAAGFINLFGDFFPFVVRTLQKAPLVGKLLTLPYIRNVVDWIAGGQTLPV